jgi:hypothetical protein
MATSKVTNLSILDDAVRTAGIQDAAVTAAKTSGVPTLFLPNAQQLLINGNMKVVQRATSKTGLTNGNSGYWVQDRWKWLEFGAPTFVQTMTQEALTSGDAFTDGFATALKLDVTTADASLAAGDGLMVEQQIEGQNLQMIKKGTANAEKLTVAFWVKSTKTGTLIAEFFDHPNSRTCSQSYTIDTTDTWEFKVLNFPADTTGALNNTNSTGLALKFWLAAGTNYTSGTLATTWQSETAANRAVGCVNTTDSTSNNVHITGVQIEVGEYTSSDLPPFRHESYGDNLARCQRYAYVISGDNQVLGFGFGKGSDNVVGPIIFPTTMRSAPTTTTTTVGTGYKFQGSKSDGTGQDQNIDGSSNVLEQAGTRGITYKMDGLSTVGGGSTGFFRTNSASAHILFSSEL